MWRQPGDGGYKRGLNNKLHLAVDAHGMPVRILLTAGTTVDRYHPSRPAGGTDAPGPARH